MVKRTLFLAACTLLGAFACGCAGRTSGTRQEPLMLGSSDQSRRQQEERIAKALKQSPAEESKGMSGAFQRTKTNVAQALTPAPKVIPADDPVRLSGSNQPLGAPVYVAAARVQEKQGNVKGALAQYQQALKVAPSDLAANLGLARLYDRQGKFPEAEAQYRRCLQLHADNAQVHNDLALCLARQGKYAESGELLAKAIALEPANMLYQNNLGAVLVEEGRIGEAVQRMAAVHGPAAAHYNVGLLLKRKNREEEAAWHFTQAVRIDPQFAPAREMLAQEQRVARTYQQTAAAGPIRHPEPERRPATADAPPTPQLLPPVD